MKSGPWNNFPVKVVYEDDDFVAVNKPAGLLAHPVEGAADEGGKNAPTLAGWLAEKYPETAEVGDTPAGADGRPLRPGMVHRLDRDTSGIIIAARNPRAFEYLKNLFKERSVKKKYVALLFGKMGASPGEKGVVDMPIGAGGKKFTRRAVSAGAPSRGKTRDAVTEYEVLEKFPGTGPGYPGYTLVAAYPKTGRTHQIRVHFKALGYPVACDKLYGFRRADPETFCPFGLKRHFLHASSIEFVAPSGTRVKLEAGLPDDLKAVLENLRAAKSSAGGGGCAGADNVIN